jgi:hypothetical protein
LEEWNINSIVKKVGTQIMLVNYESTWKFLQQKDGLYEFCPVLLLKSYDNFEKYGKV